MVSGGGPSRALRPPWPRGAEGRDRYKYDGWDVGGLWVEKYEWVRFMIRIKVRLLIGRTTSADNRGGLKMKMAVKL